jgi:DNA-binding LacI/PurR family transcriptional regulator
LFDGEPLRVAVLGEAVLPCLEAGDEVALGDVGLADGVGEHAVRVDLEGQVLPPFRDVLGGVDEDPVDLLAAAVLRGRVQELFVVELRGGRREAAVTEEDVDALLGVVQPLQERCGESGALRLLDDGLGAAAVLCRDCGAGVAGQGCDTPLASTFGHESFENAGHPRAGDARGDAAVTETFPPVVRPRPDGSDQTGLEQLVPGVRSELRALILQIDGHRGAVGLERTPTCLPDQRLREAGVAGVVSDVPRGVGRVQLLRGGDVLVPRGRNLEPELVEDGLVVHETHQVGPGQIIQGATAAARSAGYLLDVVSLDVGDPAEIDEALASLMQYDLAGVLAFSSTDSMCEALERTRFDVPVIIAAEDDEPEASPHSHASTQGIQDLVDHLWLFGHRQLLHIAGPANWSAARNRLHAFEAAVRAHGAEPVTLHGDWSARSASELIDAIPRPELPTAILAANDQMTLGTIHALHSRGLRVPGDVSVTGADDTPETPYFTPALTTVRLDFRAQGRDGVADLLAQIDGARPATESDASPPTSPLVVRASTGPAATS